MESHACHGHVYSFSSFEDVDVLSTRPCKAQLRKAIVFIMKSMAVEILHIVVGWVEDDFQNYRVVWFSLHIDAKIHHVYVDPEKIGPDKTAHMRQYKSHSMTV